MRAQELFAKVCATLRRRLAFNTDVWSYALRFGNEQASERPARQLCVPRVHGARRPCANIWAATKASWVAVNLHCAPRSSLWWVHRACATACVNECKQSAEESAVYFHLEYSPLLNARAHTLKPRCARAASVVRAAARDLAPAEARQATPRVRWPSTTASSSDACAVLLRPWHTRCAWAGRNTAISCRCWSPATADLPTCVRRTSWRSRTTCCCRCACGAGAGSRRPCALAGPRG